MFEEITKPRFDLATSVTFQESKTIPVYNWFYYKEGFSPRLVKTIVRENDLKGTGLDVFCGTGTTNLALSEMGLKNVGFDINPLMVLIAKVKTHSFDYEKTGELAKKIVSEKIKIDFNWSTQLVEEKKYFPRENFQEILELREAVFALEEGSEKNFLKLVLASIIIPCSYILKDGGVLKLQKRSTPSSKKFFERKLKEMLKEAKKRKLNAESQIFQIDSRDFELNKKIDFVITSPPYLNNVDYSKVYAFETSLLFPKEYHELRKNSLRSHAFTSYKETEEFDLEKLKKVLETERIPLQALSYLSDLKKVIKNCNKYLNNEGRMFFNVANGVYEESRLKLDHGIAYLMEEEGFQVNEIIVARNIPVYLKSGEKFTTTESIVVGTKN